MNISESEIITGERFQSLAEISICVDIPYHNQESLSRINHCNIYDSQIFARIGNARVIFVYPDVFARFFNDVYPHIPQNFVMISHNSDFPVDEKYRNILDASDCKIIKWYALNALFIHPKIIGIPIGVGNAHLAFGNLNILYNRIMEPMNKTKLCYFYFNVETNRWIRQHIRDTVQKCLNIEFGHFESHNEYLTNLSQCKYCICPIGNGADSYRFWECLYLGVIPIVEFSPVLLHFNVPYLLVSDWNDISIELLESNYDALKKKSGENAFKLSTYQNMIVNNLL
jgi:hypothetical protein